MERITILSSSTLRGASLKETEVWPLSSIVLQLVVYRWTCVLVVYLTIDAFLVIFDHFAD